MTTAWSLSTVAWGATGMHQPAEIRVSQYCILVGPDRLVGPLGAPSITAPKQLSKSAKNGPETVLLCGFLWYDYGLDSECPGARFKPENDWKIFRKIPDIVVAAIPPRLTESGRHSESECLK